MEVINIQDVWRRWRLGLLRTLPRYEPFQELSGRRRTEIALGGNGYSLFRNSHVNAPVMKQVAIREGVDPAEVCKVLRKGEEVVVSVDLERCLVRRVKLPQNAMGKIGAILSLDLARLTPFTPDDVFSGWINHGPSGADSTLNIDHVIIRKDIVAHVIEAVRNRGAEPIGIFVREGTGPALPLALAMDGSPFRASLMKLWTRLTAAGFGTLLLSATTFAAAVLVGQSQTFKSIEVQNAVVEKDAAEVRGRLEQIKAKSSEILGLQARKSGTATRLEVIEELSRTLPDDAFLSGVSMDSNRLVVDGSAKSPEPLISLLETSPAFQNVSFVSPVFRNPGEEKSHFSIRLELETLANEAAK
jgi:general secretion pathway protein L